MKVHLTAIPDRKEQHWIEVKPIKDNDTMRHWLTDRLNEGLYPVEMNYDPISTAPYYSTRFDEDFQLAQMIRSDDDVFRHLMDIIFRVMGEVKNINMRFIYTLEKENQCTTQTSKNNK